MVNNKSLFEQLQDILLQEDRNIAERIERKVESIEDDVSGLKEEVNEIKEDVFDIKENIDNPSKLGSKIDPIMQLKILELKQDFYDDVFRHEVELVVKDQLKSSQDEIIEALYPIIGKLIRHYLRLQFDSFLENVNSRLENTFSLKWWGDRMKAAFAGVSQKELIIRESFVTQVQEVFIIHSESGLLLGSYSKNNTADVDLIAGMLTAIKQFVAGTFKTKGEDLETIEYGDYKILITNFYKYYVATVTSGMVDATFKASLHEHLVQFCDSKVPTNFREIDDRLFEMVSARLKSSFNDFELKK